MKYEIFDIQNALDACRTSLKTLNISDAVESNAAVLLQSRSSSPIISKAVLNKTDKKVVLTKRKSFQKQIRTKYRQRQLLKPKNTSTKFFECEFNNSCDSMSLLSSSTTSSNTTISYGMIGNANENDRKLFDSNPNSSSADYCYESNYYPLIGTVYDSRPNNYSR